MGVKWKKGRVTNIRISFNYRGLIFRNGRDMGEITSGSVCKFPHTISSMGDSYPPCPPHFLPLSRNPLKNMEVENAALAGAALVVILGTGCHPD
jgi:hypothetical protein